MDGCLKNVFSQEILRMSVTRPAISNPRAACSPVEGFVVVYEQYNEKYVLLQRVT